VTDAGDRALLSLAPGEVRSDSLSGFNDYKNDSVPVGAGSLVGWHLMTVGGVTQWST
jgi:hypothetical protein